MWTVMGGRGENITENFLHSFKNAHDLYYHKTLYIYCDVKGLVNMKTLDIYILYIEYG